MMFQRQRADVSTPFTGTGGAGTCVCTITVPPGPSWNVQQVSISATSSSQTLANTYRNGVKNTAKTQVVNGEFISNSYSGNNDTDSQPQVLLRPGDTIDCYWSNGTQPASGPYIGRLIVLYDEVAY